MIIDEKEYIQHWNYFCSLSQKLEGTKNYVYHGAINDDNNKIELIHGDVYSDEFKQIILLTGAEFETMTRKICGRFKKSIRDIVDISTIILDHYPKIGSTEVTTLFWTGFPLGKWMVDKEKEGKKVSGLDWWDAYSSIKHDEKDSYKMATLKNAVISLASLYVIDLYVMKMLFNNLGILYSYPPIYFKCKYEPSNVFAAEGQLPDFGNKSSAEVFREMFENDTDKNLNNEI